ncbi:RNA polymerase sigma factor [Pleomorphovibrio marinus]|uniref:RNA polymerase sigma factor n=1 Tax=Pleomorphovibrio marinus TaxID=2164132 RepID=UPI000E0BAE2C|nr:sigma-70 family RNA polymerase sigma factor [Pleomorphovibrio marinus]
MSQIPKSNGKISAELLWESLKSGDKDALEQLYRRFIKELFRLGISITGDADFVQDCIQELFIDLWKYRANMKSTDNVKLYLFRSLSNKINKERRKALRWSERQQHVSERYPRFLESVETKLVNSQREALLQKKLAKAMNDLPTRQNEVIQYLFFENLSYEDTAKLMGINLRSVYTLAWKALSALKKAVLWFAFPLVHYLS